MNSLVGDKETWAAFEESSCQDQVMVKRHGTIMELLYGHDLKPSKSTRNWSASKKRIGHYHQRKRSLFTHVCGIDSVPAGHLCTVSFMYPYNAPNARLPKPNH